MMNIKPITDVNNYILLLRDRIVSRCYVDSVLGIQFFDKGYEVTICIEGSFVLVEEGQEQLLTVVDPQRLGPVLGLIGKSAMSATIFTNGSLEVMFSGDTILRIDADPNYEAWEIWENNGARIVCMPGGTLATWERG